MSDQPEITGAEENFAEMLDAFSPGKRSEVRVGDRVKGRVISIGKDTVFVDAGMKIDAVVERAELLDAEQNLTCAVDDELELYVAAVSENEVRLSRAISGAGGAQMLRDAHKGGVPVEGKVKEVCKGGYSVEVLHRRAFCPQSQIDLMPAADPAAHVGATYQFLVTRFEEKGRNIVVSRRALLSRELEVLRGQFMETLKARRSGRHGVPHHALWRLRRDRPGGRGHGPRLRDQLVQDGGARRRARPGGPAAGQGDRHRRS